MMEMDDQRTPEALAGRVERFWDVSGGKARAVARDDDAARGSPAFTIGGRYTPRGWREGALYVQRLAAGGPYLAFRAAVGSA